MIQSINYWYYYHYYYVKPCEIQKIDHLRSNYSHSSPFGIMGHIFKTKGIIQFLLLNSLKIQGAAKVRSRSSTIGDKKNKNIVGENNINFFIITISFSNFSIRGPDVCRIRQFLNDSINLQTLFVKRVQEGQSHQICQC